MARNWLKVAQGGFFAVLLFCLARGLAAVLVGLPEEISSPQAHFQDADSVIRGRAWIDENPVHHDRSATLWLSFANRSTGSAGVPADVRFLHLAAPGFVPPRGHGSGFPVFVNGSQSAGSTSDFELRLAPGEARTVRLEMRAKRFSGTYAITGVFALASGAGPGQEVIVQLPGIRVVSPLVLFVSQALDSLLALARTVALPATLAVLGWLFQQRLQRFMQERQAWASMLPTSHTNNVSFYLPLLEAVDSLKASVKASPAGTPDKEQAFFSLAYLLRCNREVPGFYLMDRKGEALTRRCWGLFVERLLNNVKRPELTRVLDAMSPKESLATYQDKMREKRLTWQVQKLERQLEQWLKRSPSDFALVFLYRELLWFEVNRIYEFWYGNKPEFPEERCRELLSPLQGGPAPKDQADLWELCVEVEEYYLKKGRRPQDT